MAVFTQIGKKNLKCTLYHTHTNTQAIPQIFYPILREKNKAENMIFSDFKVKQNWFVIGLKTDM